MIPGLIRSSGEGKGYPLQYSGLEKSVDCIVHGVTESDTTKRLALSFIKPATEPGAAMAMVRDAGCGGGGLCYCPDPSSPSPGHLPPVASNHPVLPQIHLPLPGGIAGEQGTLPPRDIQCGAWGRSGRGALESTWWDLGQSQAMTVSRGTASCLALEALHWFPLPFHPGSGQLQRGGPGPASHGLLLPLLPPV